MSERLRSGAAETFATRRRGSEYGHSDMLQLASCAESSCLNIAITSHRNGRIESLNMAQPRRCSNTVRGHFGDCEGVPA